MNNFDLKKFLTENKLTSNSRTLSEQAGDLDMEKLARIFQKGKQLRLLYAGAGFNTKQSMNDINLIGSIVKAGEEAFGDYFDEVDGLAQREIPVDLMPLDSIRNPEMKAAWEELAYALDFNAAAYEYEYPELEVYYNNLVDIVNNFPSEYL